MIVVILGAPGSGKTTVGRALARALPARFIDSDDAGAEPADPLEALRRLGQQMHEVRNGAHAVVVCSASRRVERDVLRTFRPDLRFVHLTTEASTIEHRRGTRTDGKEIAALEPLGGDEGGMSVPNEDGVETVAARILSALVLDLEAGRQLSH